MPSFWTDKINFEVNTIIIVLSPLQLHRSRARWLTSKVARLQTTYFVPYRIWIQTKKRPWLLAENETKKKTNDETQFAIFFWSSLTSRSGGTVSFPVLSGLTSRRTMNRWYIPSWHISTVATSNQHKSDQKVCRMSESRLPCLIGIIVAKSVAPKHQKVQNAEPDHRLGHQDYYLHGREGRENGCRVRGSVVLLEFTLLCHILSRINRDILPNL